MPPPPASDVTLRCQECGHENEPQRVYCHQCGTKLDRTRLPKDFKVAHDPRKLEKRVRRIMDPRRGNFERSIKKFVLSIVVGAFLGLLMAALLPPDDAPPPQSLDKASEARFISDDINAAVDRGLSQPLSYTEDGTNGYLQIAYKKREIDYLPARFERVYAKPADGEIKVVAVLTVLWWVPVYTGGTYQVRVNGGKIESNCLRGHIGRLTIPGPVMSVIEGAFSPLWTMMDRDKKAVEKCRSIAFRAGAVDIVTR